MKLQKIVNIIRPSKPSSPRLDDFYTVKEAAVRLGISESGVYYRIMTDKIPITWFGRQMLIKKSDLL